jgi:hypothetical protein
VPTGRHAASFVSFVLRNEEQEESQPGIIGRGAADNR